MAKQKYWVIFIVSEKLSNLGTYEHTFLYFNFTQSGKICVEVPSLFDYKTLHYKTYSPRQRWETVNILFRLV